MKDTLETLDLVRQFHDAFGVKSITGNRSRDASIKRLRIELLAEELGELDAALDSDRMIDVLDALTDLQYVLDGAYIALGLDKYKAAAFLEVHRSNMSKLGSDGKPILRADGKIMKGPNYSPPNLRAVIGASRGFDAVVKD